VTDYSIRVITDAACFSFVTTSELSTLTCGFDRDELSRYMEELGATCPGVMTLTTYLSRPFQQIERYSLLLKELERHSEVSCVSELICGLLKLIYGLLLVSTVNLEIEAGSEVEAGGS